VPLSWFAASPFKAIVPVITSCVGTIVALIAAIVGVIMYFGPGLGGVDMNTSKHDQEDIESTQILVICTKVMVVMLLVALAILLFWKF